MVYRLCINKCSDFYFRLVLLKPLLYKHKISALFRLSFRQKKNLVRLHLILCHVFTVSGSKIVGILLTRTVIISTYTVHCLIRPLRRLYKVLSFFKIISYEQKWQTERTSCKLKQIPLTHDLCSCKKLLLYRKRLVIKADLFYSAPERKHNIHLMAWRTVKYIWQKNLCIGADLLAHFALFNHYFHRKTAFYLSLRKYCLYTYALSLHLLRHLGAESELHRLLRNIHCNSVINLSHNSYRFLSLMIFKLLD